MKWFWDKDEPDVILSELQNRRKEMLQKIECITNECPNVPKATKIGMNWININDSIYYTENYTPNNQLVIVCFVKKGTVLKFLDYFTKDIILLSGELIDTKTNKADTKIDIKKRYYAKQDTTVILY
jgi:hypothetical protein